MKRPTFVLLAATLGLLPACTSAERFSTGTGSFRGGVVAANFVRAGVAEDVELCLTFDADRLQDRPGVLSTSDGLFAKAPMQVVPQVWHDPLASLDFGVGRTRNLVYVATDSRGRDVTVFLSLLEGGDAEVRLLRGSPQSASGGLFAVFPLQKSDTPCAY